MSVTRWVFIKDNRHGRGVTRRAWGRPKRPERKNKSSNVREGEMER